MRLQFLSLRIRRSRETLKSASSLSRRGEKKKNGNKETKRGLADNSNPPRRTNLPPLNPHHTHGREETSMHPKFFVMECHLTGTWHEVRGDTSRRTAASRVSSRALKVSAPAYLNFSPTIPPPPQQLQPTNSSLFSTRFARRSSTRRVSRLCTRG